MWHKNYKLVIAILLLFPAVVFAQQTSLKITASADRAVANAEDTITYRLTATNAGNTPINNGSITVTIPDNITPLATSPEAQANPQARTLIWPNISLPPNSSKTFAFKAQPSANTAPGSVIRIHAAISGNGVSSSTDTSITVGSKINATAKTGVESSVLIIAITFSGLIGLSYTLMRYKKQLLH